MAFSILQAWKHAVTSSPPTQTDLVLTSVPIAGNLLVVVVHFSISATTVAMTDSIGDGVGWNTGVGPVNDSSSAYQRQYIFWKVVGTPSGGAKTLTATWSGGTTPGTLGVDAAEYQSAGGVISLDGTATSASGHNVGPATTTGITTTGTEGLVISTLTDNAANYTTPTGGFTNRAIGNGTTDQSDIWNNNVADQYTSSAATYTPSQVLGGSEFWINMAIGFKAATASPAASYPIETILYF
jgi:hypothetical protein